MNKNTSTPELRKIYLDGWEVELNGDEQCLNFMHTQAIDAETAEHSGLYLELIFREGLLAEAFQYTDGVREVRPLSDAEKGLPYRALTPHRFFDFQRATQAESWLGGECPPVFRKPKPDVAAPFQYVGMLSAKDPALAWLPFDLHLTAPLYIDFYELFLDYSDPLAPVVLQPEELDDISPLFDELHAGSEVVFEKVPFVAQPSKRPGGDLGFTGVPQWLQYPRIPVCPVSGNTMRFLCQLRTNTDIKVQRTNVVCQNQGMQSYFRYLNFWGDGDLFVFIEPESRVVGYVIQST